MLIEIVTLTSLMSDSITSSPFKMFRVAMEMVAFATL